MTISFPFSINPEIYPELLNLLLESWMNPIHKWCIFVVATFLSFGIAQSQTLASPKTDSASVFIGMKPVHITLSVANIEVERIWYAKAFGFKVSRK